MLIRELLVNLGLPHHKLAGPEHTGSLNSYIRMIKVRRPLLAEWSYPDSLHFRDCHAEGCNKSL